MAIKEYLTKIEEELLKLKEVDNSIAKDVLDNVNEYLSEVKAEIETGEETSKEEETEIEDNSKEEPEAPAEGETKEEVKEEKEEKKEEPVEDTKEETTEKPVKEDTEVTQEEETTKDNPEELSLDIAKKLKEAALELSKFESEIASKEEIISSYKQRITELEAELETYKESEKLELQKKYESKVNSLVELYKKLGIEKEQSHLMELFNEDQIDKMIVDLSAIVPKQSEPAQKSVRATRLSEGLELSKYTKTTKKPKEMNETDRANVLFDFSNL